MAINLTKVLTQIQNRISDSATSASDLNKLIATASRINNSGTQVLTYQSTGQLPSLADSSYVGVIARVASDNVFGDSDGRYYYASGTDSGWRGFKTTQDSADAAIAAPGGGASGPLAYAGANAYQMYELVGKFDMSSNTTASGIPALGTNLFPDFSRGRASGRSATKGYYMFNFSPNDTSIDAFPFAAEDAMTDTTGTLTQVRKNFQGEPVGDGLFCYAAGGFNPGVGIVNTVDKFPTAADDQAGTDVGDLTVARQGQAHVSSTTFGYAAGGGGPPGAKNVIDKFPFATDANATDVGDLLNPSQALAGASSTTHGYAAGGHGTPAPGNRRNNIDKFAFASDGNSTDVGDLASTKDNTGGASSASYGFALGGAAGAAGNTIHRWAFASDGNATDYADMHESTQYAAVTHDTA